MEKKFPESAGGLLLSVGILIILLVIGLSFAPLWPCPVCFDLDTALFSCKDCGGSNQPQFRRRISFWKRRALVHEIRCTGNERIRLWVPAQK